MVKMIFTKEERFMELIMYSSRKYAKEVYQSEKANHEKKRKK
jgi:hypothetical protein